MPRFSVPPPCVPPPAGVAVPRLLNGHGNCPQEQDASGWMFSGTAFPGTVTPASPGAPAAQLLGLRPLMRSCMRQGRQLAGKRAGRDEHTGLGDAAPRLIPGSRATAELRSPR